MAYQGPDPHALNINDYTGHYQCIKKHFYNGAKITIDKNRKWYKNGKEAGFVETVNGQYALRAADWQANNHIIYGGSNKQGGIKIRRVADKYEWQLKFIGDVKDDDTDAATGLRLKDALQTTLKDLCSMNANAAFIATDMDWMKKVNDEQGHEITDQIIARIGNILRTKQNDNFLAFRYYAKRSDEFGIIINNVSNKNEIGQIAESVRQRVQQQTGQTISMGIAIRKNESKYNYMNWFNRAEEALRNAKKEPKKNTIRFSD